MQTETAIAIIALLCCGCSDKIESSESELRVSYDSIGGASSLSGGQETACEIAAVAEQAGEYEVASLTGVYEEFPIGSGKWEARTYVELKLLNGWTKSAADVTLRVHGGPHPDGSTTSHFISVKRGERVGAVVQGPYAWNADYPIVDSNHLFHFEDNILTNGKLRGTSEQFADVIGQAAESGNCPNDIRPDSASDHDDEVEDQDPTTYPEDMGTSDAG